MTTRSNDGLECFNFQLLLDDINSTSHKKKRGMFLSPQPDLLKRPRITDSEVNRNLGLEFSKAGAEPGLDSLSYLNLNMFTKEGVSGLFGSKVLTRETYHTEQSANKAARSLLHHPTTLKKNQNDFSVWGNLSMPRQLSPSDPEDDGSEEQEVSKGVQLRSGLGAAGAKSAKKPERNLMMDLSKDLGFPNNAAFSDFKGHKPIQGTPSQKQCASFEMGIAANRQGALFMGPGQVPGPSRAGALAGLTGGVISSPWNIHASAKQTQKRGKQGQVQTLNGGPISDLFNFNFLDQVSTVSADLKFPPYRKGSGSKIKPVATLDALSESFEPSGGIPKKIKKNSMSACKPTGLSRYRKLSHNEREVQGSYLSGTTGTGLRIGRTTASKRKGKNRVVYLSKYVASDLEEVVSCMTKLIDQRIQKRSQEDFPQIGGVENSLE